MSARHQSIQPPTLHIRTLDGHVLYSHVVIAEGRRQIFISGQLARNSAGAIVGKGDMRAQIQQVGENLKICLEAAGAGLADLVKTTTYVTDIDAFFVHADLRMIYFGPGIPASTTVEVRRLSHPDFLIEVDAIAVTD
jgi:enamine deaminase RidA (YjgF/YER057c/UK114 family)